MGSTQSYTLEEMYDKFDMPPVPSEVMTDKFEREMYYTLNLLRTEPGLMSLRLKTVKKKFGTKKKVIFLSISRFVIVLLLL